MTYSLTNLPEGYEPYERLTICSNVLEGGGHVMSIGESLPLIIGKGEEPRIWIQAVVESNTSELMPIVEISEPQHPKVAVLPEQDRLRFLVSDVTRLDVREVSKTHLAIDQLDFRPIGINIYGNRSALVVGGGTYAGNFMSGGAVMIGFKE